MKNKQTYLLFLILLCSGMFNGPALAEAKIDPSLFQLLKQSDTVRVLVSYTSDSLPKTEKNAHIRAVKHLNSRVFKLLDDKDYSVKRTFNLIPAIAIEVNTKALKQLKTQAFIAAIHLDEGGAGNLLEANTLTGVDLLSGLGYQGQGSSIAVLDSGIDTDHADFAGVVAAQACFCSINGSTSGCCPNGEATQFGDGAAEDNHGHGTNVSGIIASRGSVGPSGAAPLSQIVAVKVLDGANSFCCSSDVIAGLDWVLSDHPEVQAVNMSLGTNANFAGDCDSSTSFTIGYAAVIDALKNAGILSFVSSGNQASGTHMQAPACVANAISVGAVWDADVGEQTVLGCSDTSTAADQITCFSNLSTTTDILAPGAPITSSGLGGTTSTFFGTSQASPQVAACAALILSTFPQVTVEELEAALKTSGPNITSAVNSLSYPRLDCALAFESLSLSNANTFARNFTGTWYDPLLNGQGIFLQMINRTDDATGLTVTWYTYADAKPIWFIGSFNQIVPIQSGIGQSCENTAGNFTASFDIFNATGGQFGIDFNPTDATIALWGSATLCLNTTNDTVAFSYQGNNGLNGAFDFTRLSQIDGLNQSPVPALPTGGVLSNIHTGAWFNPMQPGQGLFLEIIDKGDNAGVNLTWYGFRDNEQIFLVGQSATFSYGISQIVVPVFETDGAQFGDDFNPADVNVTAWGNITLGVIDCNNLTLTYDGTDGTGMIPLSRLTSVKGLPCE